MDEPLSRRLAKLKKHLEALGCRFAVVGGLAVSARTRPRMTKDVDVAVAVCGDSEAEAIVRHLMATHYTVGPEDVFENLDTHRMSTVRMRSRDSDSTEPDSDLLFASSGIELEIVDAATGIEFGAASVVPVAVLGHLIATKVLSERPDRPQDRDDLCALLRVAGADDLELARTSLGLIAERGYARSKDLPGRLAAFIREFAPGLREGPEPR